MVGTAESESSSSSFTPGHRHRHTHAHIHAHAHTIERTASTTNTSRLNAVYVWLVTQIARKLKKR